MKHHQKWQDLVEGLSLTAKNKKVSHKTIAADMGVTRQNVQRILSGKKTPQLKTFTEIANILGVKIDLK